MAEPKFSYEKAKQELDQIIAELDSGEVPVDTLAKHVKRAGELIRLCKQKLRNAEDEVNGILKDMMPDE